MLFRVVKCFKCNFYQVDSVKKAQKWQCKMCGENQTLQTEYSRGSAKDCRLQVQKLNIANAENSAQRYQFAEKVLSGEIHLPEPAQDQEESGSFAGSSKWADLLDQESDDKTEESGDTNTESKPLKSWKTTYENNEDSTRNKKFHRDFLSANNFKETDLKDKVYPKKSFNESNPPSWKEFYGKKRESAKERKEFEEKSRKFFSPSYSTYQNRDNRSMPLPKLLDYTQMQRGRQKKVQRTSKEESSDFLGSNEAEQKPELLPPAKRYKAEEGSFVKNPIGTTASSIWASFCDSDEE
ncbi:uncharacterized protein LOC129804239 [Phlebotomus papatasi]|uniref:uncharacterized protein LOC129804239 n=1 Tax=Phlebotomus papatasi TaxID=29031 RepID=UPI0024845544|nr:uncharacterized protein LOC129804239 [Phlebotomus papatasi]